MKIEIKKGLKDIKSFVIDELKNEDSNWRKVVSVNETTNYSSKWLDINISSIGVEIHLNNDEDFYYRTKYDIKDIGLSRLRFNWLINRNVEKFITRKEEIRKMGVLVDGWNKFLNKNKSLNRDKKLEKLLK